MKEEKQIKIKKKFYAKSTFANVPAKRQRRKSRKEQFANLYKSRSAGMDTIGLCHC